MADIADIYLKQSYEKCKELGLDPLHVPGLKQFVTKEEFKAMCDADQDLIYVASSLLKRFTNALAPFPFLSSLANSESVLLNVNSSEGMTGLQKFLRIFEGGYYTEEFVGTNAISLAFKYDSPITINGDEHFHESLKDWVCYSAPIHNSDEEIIAVVGCLFPLALNSVILNNLFNEFAGIIELGVNFYRNHNL